MTPEERLRELRRRPKERAATSDGPRVEILGFYKDRLARVTWVDHDESGRPVRFEAATLHSNERGVSTEIAECEWQEGELWEPTVVGPTHEPASPRGQLRQRAIRFQRPCSPVP